MGTFFYSSNTFVSVCIYVSIGEVIKVYVGAGWVVFSSFFSPSIVFIFLLSLGWGFFLFHSNGFLRRLAYYKAYLFFSSSYFLFSRFPRKSIIYWTSRLFFTFISARLAGRILFKRKEEEERKGEVNKKERCDGWKGEGGETMEVFLFSLVG